MEKDTWTKLVGRLARTASLAVLCLAASGCVDTEVPFLPLVGEKIELPSDVTKSCDGKGYCYYNWHQPAAVKGKYIGGTFITDRDVRYVSFHRLDTEHYIAQVTSYPLSRTRGAQYMLVRVRNNRILVHGVELRSLNPQYLQELVEEGMVRDTTPELLRKTGYRSWEVLNKEGLLRIHGDVSKLPDDVLATTGESKTVSSAGVEEWRQNIVSTSTRHARNKLEDGVPDLNIAAAKAGAKGCPAVLPPKVHCQEYVDAPPDPFPWMPREVIHFDKYGCGYCRSIEKYVAAWQLRDLSITHFNSSVIDWKERDTIAYNVTRVPSFVVNRKYLVSLETSDKALVEYALSLVTALAYER